MFCASIGTLISLIAAIIIAPLICEKIIICVEKNAFKEKGNCSSSMQND